MPVTYKLISTVTVSTATAANIEFTNIPATFDDLVLKFSVRMSNSTNVVDDVTIALNGATTSFSMRRLFGAGSGTPASDIGGGNYNWVAQAPNAGATASTFSNSEIYIPNYAGSTNKSISADSVSENNGTAAYAFLGALLRSNTAAITSITLGGLSSNFVQYSSASLYGIKKS